MSEVLPKSIFKKNQSTYTSKGETSNEWNKELESAQSVQPLNALKKNLSQRNQQLPLTVAQRQNAFSVPHVRVCSKAKGWKIAEKIFDAEKENK